MLRIILAGILCLHGLMVAHAEDYLALRESIDNNKNQLTLADVVDVAKTSNSLLQKYGAIAIPYSGKRINSSMILLTLSKAGADLDKIKMIDPADFVIAGNVESEFDFRLKTELIKLICQQQKCSELDSKNLQIELLEANFDRSKLTSYQSIQITNAFQVGAAQDISHLQINFLDANGLTIGTTDLKMRVFLEKDVLVAKTNLAQGEYVDAASFTTAKIKVGLGEEYFYHVEDLGHAQIKMPSSLAQNMPLLKSYVERKLKMQKGDVVTLFVGNDRVSIKTMGKVKELIENGNSVLVENIDSKKELMGKPISDNEVQIAF